MKPDSLPCHQSACRLPSLSLFLPLASFLWISLYIVPLFNAGLTFKGYLGELICHLPGFQW